MKKSLLSFVFAEKIEQAPLPERLQEVPPLFGQGVHAPPAPARGRHEPGLPQVAEVLVRGRERYAEPLRQRVPVGGPPTDLLQDALLRRTDDPHAEPRLDSGTSHKCIITEKSDILKMEV